MMITPEMTTPVIWRARFGFFGLTIRKPTAKTCSTSSSFDAQQRLIERAACQYS